MTPSESTAPSDSLLAEPPKGQGSCLIARQPIVDTQRAVVAHALFDRTAAEHAHSASSDVAMLFNAMADSGDALKIEAKPIFIHRTHDGLSDASLDFVQPERVVVHVAPVPGHDSAVIAAVQKTLVDLRERGFRLAFNHTVVAPAYQSWQGLANFVKLDMLGIGSQLLEPLIAAIRARTQAQIIAEKIETPELFTTASSLGITLFQGYWIAHPKVVKLTLVAPSEMRILQLFNLVREQASVDKIEAILKHDAVLGFNLLRLINSAGFGLRQEVTSFRHAVMLMGMKRLFRWTALLMTTYRDNGSAPVVSSTAVVRGRMMELLGVATMSQEECDTAFVVGIFSLLEEMLCVPLEAVLAQMTLPAAVREALLHGTGVYGQMLALVKAAESNDEVAFMQAAIALNYSNHHINVAHMEAIVWADSLVF